MAQRQSSLFCILPPYMLEHIAENGSAAQRAKAAQTNRQTSDLRSQRLAMIRQPATPHGEAAGRQRSVYSGDHLTNLPGRLIRIEDGPPSGDAAVDEAYDGAGVTYDLFWEIYQRNSIDGKGMRLDSSVHYQVGYNNAFWNGSQMVYGDGDEDLPPAERLFNRFTICADVIAHELTHGVTQFTGNLTYLNQPGALNESLSDVFGSLARQRSHGQIARDADWIIGKGLLTANVTGTGLRSMKEPGTAYNDPVLGKDPQPGHISNYVNTTSDNGGVHINSGIPNRAFYLTAIELDGYAWEKAGRIWYVTLRDRIGANTNFQEAANLTSTVAGELFGKNSPEQQAVGKGWAGVGITVTTASLAQKPGCLGALLGLSGSH